MANDLVNRRFPAGNSSTQATTTAIARDMASHGIEARAGTLAGNESASYGYFFHTTPAGACNLRVSNPDCVTYTLARVQLAVGVHTNPLCFAVIGCLTHGPTPLVVGAGLTIDDGSGPGSICLGACSHPGDLPNIPGSDGLDTSTPCPRHRPAAPTPKV